MLILSSRKLVKGHEKLLVQLLHTIKKISWSFVAGLKIERLLVIFNIAERRCEKFSPPAPPFEISVGLREQILLLFSQDLLFFPLLSIPNPEGFN